VPLEERSAIGGEFLSEFLAGYREVRSLSRDWLAIIPDLLELQRIMNYALFHQYRDRARIREEEREYWRISREAIGRGVAILPLDFRAFGG
jgi:Ser/Thr protein kinase RdoA (MazF antagonist)